MTLFTADSMRWIPLESRGQRTRTWLRPWYSPPLIVNVTERSRLVNRREGSWGSSLGQEQRPDAQGVLPHSATPFYPRNLPLLPEPLLWSPALRFRNHDTLLLGPSQKILEQKVWMRTCSRACSNAHKENIVINLVT